MSEHEHEPRDTRVGISSTALARLGRAWASAITGRRGTARRVPAQISRPGCQDFVSIPELTSVPVLVVPIRSGSRTTACEDGSQALDAGGKGRRDRTILQGDANGSR